MTCAGTALWPFSERVLPPPDLYIDTSAKATYCNNICCELRVQLPGWHSAITHQAPGKGCSKTSSTYLLYRAFMQHSSFRCRRTLLQVWGESTYQGGVGGTCTTTPPGPAAEVPNARATSVALKVLASCLCLYASMHRLNQSIQHPPARCASLVQGKATGCTFTPGVARHDVTLVVYGTCSTASAWPPPGRSCLTSTRTRPPSRLRTWTAPPTSRSAPTRG